MIEWRDTYETDQYGDRPEYQTLSNEEIVALHDQLDDVFHNYVKGAVEGEIGYTTLDDGGSSTRVRFDYSDVDANAHNEPVLTNTSVLLEHITDHHPYKTESYKVSIVRQIVLDHKHQIPLDGRVFVEASRYVKAPLIETYTLQAYKGGFHEAMIDQIDLTTVHGEMKERTMTAYDAAQLLVEFGRIEKLYDAAKKERAIIEQ
jgi:hypothetical protein